MSWTTILTCSKIKRKKRTGSSIIPRVNYNMYRLQREMHVIHRWVFSFKKCKFDLLAKKKSMFKISPVGTTVFGSF